MLVLATVNRAKARELLALLGDVPFEVRVLADYPGAVARIPGLDASAVLRDCVAAVSVGIVKGQPVLDLNYAEDSSAEVDMNVVMTGGGEFVEVQGTAEQTPFARAHLDALLSLAEQGIRRLVALQRQARAARDQRTFTL